MSWKRKNKQGVQTEEGYAEIMGKNQKTSTTQKLAHLEAFSRNGAGPWEMLDALKSTFSSVVNDFEPSDLAHSLHYLRSTVEILRKDSDRCHRLYDRVMRDWSKEGRSDTEDSIAQFEEIHFYCRLLIRTFFAEVEGTLYAMRKTVLWGHDRGEIDLSLADQAVLRQESYRYDVRQRKAESSPGNFGRAEDSVIISFDYLSRLLGSDFVLDKADNGWQCFKDLIKVRNRITHPKNPLDLSIETDVFLTTLPRARDWYHGCLASLLQTKEA